MAHIRQLPSGKWNALIRRPGHKPISITKELKADLEREVRKVDGAIDEGTPIAMGDARKITVRDIFMRYRKEVAERVKSWRSLCHRIDKWCTEPWVHLKASDKTLPQAIQAYRDRRLKEVKATTVRLELGRMSAAFNYAVKEWHLPIQNPVARIKRPAAVDRARKTIWTYEQLQTALDYFGFDPERAPTSTADFMGWTIALLRRTGLRLGTLCLMELPMLRAHQPVLDLPGSIIKNGEDFECGLDHEAEALLRKLAEHRKGRMRFIEPGADVMSSTWTNTRRVGHPFLIEHPEMAGLRLHDLRHTFTTEKVPLIRDPMTLAKVLGRSDLKVMMGYYNPDAVELAKLLNAPADQPAAGTPTDISAILAQMAALQQALMQATKTQAETKA